MKNAFICLLLSGFAALAANPGVLTLPGATSNTNRPGIVSVGTNDTDAAKFLARAGLAPHTSDADAVAALVFDLKSEGLWSKLIGFYPFIGTDSNAMALNLCSTNYALTFYGTNAFSTNGFKPDGQSGYADTGYNPSGAGLSQTNWHLYVWTTTNQIPAGATNMILIGANDVSNWIYLGGGVGILQAANTSGGPFSALSNGCDGNVLANYTANDAFHIQTSSTNWFTATDQAVQPTTDIFIGVDRNAFLTNQFAATYFRAASFGASFTPAQATNYFNAIRKFQRSLGRSNPNTP